MSAYPRHNAGGQGARTPSRPTEGRGHARSWSGSSSNDGTANALGLTGLDDEATPLASDPSAMVDRVRNEQQGTGWAMMARNIRPHSLRKVLIFLSLVFILFGGAWLMKHHAKHVAQGTPAIDMYLPPIPQLSDKTFEPGQVDPLQWLRENTFLDINELPAHYLRSLVATRPQSAFIALVRNSELDGMVYSIKQLEARFNSRVTHHYDWVFFNEEEFSEEFMEAVADATDSHCHFEIIPKEHWSIPSWIDETRFDVGREFMGNIGVGKAWLQSYHHMCRWNAGLFAMEERLADYDFFWRVEPGVDFSCNINYDVFRFMRDNNMAYGFNMAILDDARSFPSLWERTKAFMKTNADLIDEESDMDWLLQDTRASNGHDHSSAEDESSSDHLEYNNCQFYSNFEIGSLDFFRGTQHRAFFEHLDRAGGFYYERFGDAPVHTLSVSMFLPKRRIWYFRDIGYAHGLCEQCPPHHFDLAMGPDNAPDEDQAIDVYDFGQSLEGSHQHWERLAEGIKEKSVIPGLACGCTVSAIDAANDKLVPFESKQQKPDDSCVRMFLDGVWIQMNSEGNLSEELAASGSVLRGYKLSGLEANPFWPEV